MRVSDEEIGALARRLELADAEFRVVFTRELRGGEVSLRERGNRDCIFYDRERGCSVYEDRPRQCRTWPFWQGVVHSPERWQEETRGCPGMNNGPLHSAQAIESQALDDGTSGQAPEEPPDSSPSGTLPS